MGKRKFKTLDVNQFEDIGGGFIVAMRPAGYAIAYKERNNVPGWKVWVLLGRKALLSYDEKGWRVRDCHSEIARRLEAVPPEERSALLQELLPEGVSRGVQQCWAQRETHRRAYYMTAVAV